MTCEIKKGPGFTTITCGGRPRRKQCSEFGCWRYEDKLCDFRLANGKTCDRPLCSGHAVKLSDRPGLDYCGPHSKMKEGDFPKIKL